VNHLVDVLHYFSGIGLTQRHHLFMTSVQSQCDNYSVSTTDKLHG